MIIQTFILLSIFGHSSANAKDLDVSEAFCSQLTVDEIMEEQGMEDCEQNTIFVEIAKSCQVKLKNSIAALAKNITVADINAKAANQKADFHTSQAKEESAKQGLSYAITAASTGLEEIGDFQSELIYPEDSDEQEVTGGDTEDYIMNTTCYGDSWEALEEIRLDFEKQKAELEATYKTASTLSTQSGEREGRQNNASGSAVITKRGTAPSDKHDNGKIPTGSHPQQESTITGNIDPAVDLSAPPAKK